MKRLWVGTSNAGKLRELRQLLTPLGYEVRSVEEKISPFEVVEDGDTFEKNALKKARAVFEMTGETSLADDSGLVVDALGGKPGVHSARYAGVEGDQQDAANRNKLLKDMAHVADDDRSARFVCVLALCAPGEEAKTFSESFEGKIGYEERGSNGFGYDSIFVVAGDKRSSAELSPLEKNALSHRGKAVKKLVTYLQNQQDRP